MSDDDDTTVTDANRAAAYRALLLDLGHQRVKRRRFSAAKHAAGGFLVRYGDEARVRLQAVACAAAEWGLSTAWQNVDAELEQAGVPAEIQEEMRL